MICFSGLAGCLFSPLRLSVSRLLRSSEFLFSVALGSESQLQFPLVSQVSDFQLGAIGILVLLEICSRVLRSLMRLCSVCSGDCHPSFRFSESRFSGSSGDLLSLSQVSAVLLSESQNLSRLPDFVGRS